MKRSYYAVAAAMLALSSCSNEDLTLPMGDSCEVTFTAALPAEINSRSYADGTQAKSLHYAVYEANSDQAIYASDDAATNAPEPVSVDAKNFTLKLSLIKGKSYDLIFWADAENNEFYTFSSATKTVSVNYENVEGSDDSRDAFFQTEKALAVNGPLNKTITLKRPFAQLNVGTSDITAAVAAGQNVTSVTTVVEGVHNELNLFTGIASGEENLTFVNELPEGESFPVKGYDYLSMNYILSGTELSASDVQKAKQELMDAAITIELSNANPVNIEVPNVPVQRNYRTNIYGTLITSPLNLTITVNPAFSGNHNIEVWDGSITKPEANAKGNYDISSPAELAGLAQMLKEGESFEGKTITLKNDIYLDGKAWTSIGNSKDKAFNGTFDGKSHTIYDLSAPVFSYINGATVKDVTINSLGGNAAVASNSYGDSQISGVTVNGTITGFGAGAIVYRVYEGSSPLTIARTTPTFMIPDTVPVAWLHAVQFR